jgi:hypothetical protein
MACEIGRFLGLFAQEGATVSFFLETSRHLPKTIEMVRDWGSLLGIDFHSHPWLFEAVNPGYIVQRLVLLTLGKAQLLRHCLDARDLPHTRANV